MTTGSEMLERARGLSQLIDENASKVEGGPIAAETVGAMSDAGLYGAMIPRAVGGSELSLTECLDLFAEVSRADGSSGWCLMASNTAATFFAAWCPDTFTDRVFGEGVPIVAGQFAPFGKATKVDDGWRLTGSYQFGSGLNDAAMVGAGAFTVPEDGADPEFRIFTIPKSEAQLLGNWEVMGLKGTASWDYAIDDVFVPDDATFDFFAPTRHRGGPVYDLGVLPLTSLGHAAWAIGLVRRAIDELVTLAQEKQRLGAPSTLADSEHVHMEIAMLEARFRAAKSWVYDTFAAAEAHVVDGGQPDPKLSVDARMATTFVNQEGADIIRGAYLLAGTSGLRAGALQRCFRDIHAGTQHAMVSPNVTREFGNHLLSTP